jgi:hypothetical protein
MVRTSERRMFRDCPQAWWWRYREGLVPKGRPAPELWFGTGIHLALAEWYGYGFKRGRRPATTFKNWIGTEEVYIKTEDRDTFEDARELGISMLTRYVDHYGKDYDLETLAIEQPFQIDILDEGGHYVCTSVGTFDGVHLDHTDDGIYLKEHKTAANIATAYLALDDQAGTYFAVADQVLSSLDIIDGDDHIDGIEYNFLRKAKPDLRPVNERGLRLNKDGSVSKSQPQPEFHREVIERSPSEVNRQLQRLRDDALVMKAMRDGTIPVIKNTTYRCPRCPFFDMCTLDEKGNSRAVRSVKASSFVQIDPYADHHKSASE